MSEIILRRGEKYINKNISRPNPNVNVVFALALRILQHTALRHLGAFLVASNTLLPPSVEGRKAGGLGGRLTLPHFLVFIFHNVF